MKRTIRVIPTVLLMMCAVLAISGNPAEAMGSLQTISDAGAHALSVPVLRRRSADYSEIAGEVSPERKSASVPVEPPTEFQHFVSESLGFALPLFGHDLFEGAPSTFAPLDRVPVTADYVVGPGDELILRSWGQVDIDLRLVVDRNGFIHIPKVGDINVTGVRFEQLQELIRTSLGRVFRNFDLTVTMGELRSIQVFVVGQAKRPGNYTVSSLSTLVNALFASGGPSARGSMRNIELRRGSNLVTRFDIYDLLLRGDKSLDQRLLPGDVIYVPPVGPIVALAGSVQMPAIYEVKEGTTVREMVAMAGGLAPTASVGRVVIERVIEGRARETIDSTLSGSDLHDVVQNGDIVRVLPISQEFDNTITLRGSVAWPGRFPFHPGMRISDLIRNRKFLLTRQHWSRENHLAIAGETDAESVTKNGVVLNRADINWNYAVVQRFQEDLSTRIIPFHLGRALDDVTSPDNIELNSGDVVTIFSQNDITVPASQRSRYVRLEGEIASAGVYRVQPGETLRQVLQRAGGLTSEAYIFGSEFRREAVRKDQAERYAKYLQKLEGDLGREAAGVVTDSDPRQRSAEIEQHRELIRQMRTIQPDGRIVLRLHPQDEKVDAFPDIELEDGDRLLIPQKPASVSVMGAVFNANVLLYEKHVSVDWYLANAGGPTRDADKDSIFVIRADGSILSQRMTNGAWKKGFREVLPGDTIVVPFRVGRSSFMKNLKDWSQVISQFALGVAAVRVLEQ